MIAPLKKIVVLLCFASATFAATPTENPLLKSLFAANDEQVGRWLKNSGAEPASPLGGPRPLGAEIMTLAIAYTQSQSIYYHKAETLTALDGLTAKLRKVQLADGLFDVGNLDAPPDSAFILKTVAKAQLFLERDHEPASASARGHLKELILKIAEGVRTGGIHTPNHRWAVCTALAHVNELYPDPKYVERIDDWLGEGIDVDADGQWAERSPHYTADVNDPSLLDLAILLKRPELFEFIRRNLEMTVYLLEGNGELELVASRRQDQAQRAREYLWAYYVPYRYLAIRDQNPRFAGAAAEIEKRFLAELGSTPGNMSSPLSCLLEYPEMQAALPEATPLPTNYVKVLSGTAMARIRRENTTATIFGGSDWHLGYGVSSGLSANPAFFKFRKGQAVLDSVRFSTGFFNLGFFYSDGLKSVGDNTYELSETLRVPYHLPLPKALRNPQGDYKMSPDGRYYSKMDFGDRPSHFVTLTTKITVRENKGAFDLDFDVNGYAGVPVTLELCFRPDGTLAGVSPPESSRETRGARSGPSMENERDSFLLKDGFGTYQVGEDKIEFGPGSFAHSRLRMEGELYAVYNGNMRAEGLRVYLTGMTPFKHTLSIK